MKYLHIWLSITCFLVACTVSVEKQENAWKKNEERLLQLIRTYPKLSSLLYTELSKARTVKQQADSTTDKKQKYAYLTEANKLINSKICKTIDSLDWLYNNLVTQREMVLAMSLKEDNDINTAEQLLNRHNRQKQETENALDDKYTTVENAYFRLEKYVAQLSDLSTDFDSFIKRQEEQ